MADVLNVAYQPGMPDCIFEPPAGAVAPVAMTADDPAALAAFGPPVWGIFSNGAPVVVADTVLDVGYSKGFTISDFPVEQGAFASFDKVEQPFDGRIRLASGGSLANREALIASVEAIISDTNFYDVVTPEKVYINANVVREEYRRTQGEAGNSLLVMEVAVQEVRELAGSGGSNTADPASTDPVNGGTVVATPANQSQIAAMGGTPVTTPLPATLDSGVSGLPAANPVSGGIGSA